ncbi:MAG: NADH:flavin oxidoreductase [Proteobacteria bacterium]|nr:NADH:flavin oxidoreductase [Pseudomonadota bacterium]
MLHESLTLRCGLVLPNRVALAPMTNLQSHADGTLGDDELAFLARRADGGFGLIQTCAAYVGQDGKAWPGELGIDRDEELPGLRRLAARIRAGGATSMVQLFHGGVRADAELSGAPTWSASTWEEPTPGFVPPRAATEADLQRVIAQFVAAAQRAEAAGFDGVELHGAHGYLLSQFMSRTMNPRTDGWGGDLVGRARLVRTVTQQIRAACKPTFAVGVRLSLEDFGQARGMDLDDNLQIATWLADDGADFIHASLWDVGRKTAKRPEAHAIPLLRAALPRAVAIIAAGKIWSRADAEGVLALGADLVALGRAGILNPDWPRQVASGTEPMRPPITKAQLAERAVSPVFADYLTKWKGLVAD